MGSEARSTGKVFYPYIKLVVFEANIKQSTSTNLLGAFDTFERTIKRQYTNIQYELHDQTIGRRTTINFLLPEILQRVSTEAINRVETLTTRYLPLSKEKPQIPTICECRKGSGLPCIHQIQQYYHTKRPLQLVLFHAHWHLQTLEKPHFHPDLLLVQEPRIREIGGSQKKTGSQGRLPSTFEILDSQEDAADRQLQESLQEVFSQQNKGRRQMTCSNCRRYSYHNMDYCPEPLRPDLVAEKAKKAAAKAAAKAKKRQGR